jgi:hypothetical protein
LIIGVVAQNTVDKALHNTLRMLCQVFDVTLEDAQDGREDKYDAFISFGRMRSAVNDSRPYLLFADGKAIASGDEIQFSASPLVPRAFRGATLSDPSLSQLSSIEAPAGFEVLAKCGRNPAWLRSRDGMTHISAISLPKSGEGDLPYRIFSSACWFSTLPLLTWLKTITEEDFSAPPLRASVIIDDPNLHSRYYGFIDYRSLGLDAEQQNYHAAIATIPLDAWYSNRTAVRYFSENQRRLSLMIHGNNHLHGELAQHTVPERALSNVRQGIQRIRSLEARSGLRVSRVMAAPHGACNQANGRAMLLAGYEAACISTGSLKTWNPEVHWQPGFGLWMAYPLGGLPVFHRQGPAGARINARLMAFLDQAVIFTIHHTDFRDGFDVIGKLAAAVNEIGSPVWANMTTLARSNFRFRRRGDHIDVTSYSYQFELLGAADCRTLAITIPWLGRTDLDLRSSEKCYLGNYELRSTVANDNLMVQCVPTDNELRDLEVPFSIWPWVRRSLTEGRDRLLPLTPPRRRSRA